MTTTNGYVTLSEVKSWLAITSTSSTDDAVIEDMIEGASRLIDRLTGGRTFYARSETHYYALPSSQTLYIDDDDLLSISTLKNGDGTELIASQYNLIPRNQTPKYAIKLASGYSWMPSSSDNDFPITIYGSWGKSTTVPDDIKQACHDIVANAYHRRFGQGQSGQTIIAGGGIMIAPEDVPSTAMTIIRGHKRMF